MASKKKTYLITNAAEDIFKMKYDLSENEFKFLSKLFKTMNEESRHCYVGDLYVEEVKEN